jgi:hypothetical protein
VTEFFPISSSLSPAISRSARSTRVLTPVIPPTGRPEDDAIERGRRRRRDRARVSDGGRREAHVRGRRIEASDVRLVESARPRGGRGGRVHAHPGLARLAASQFGRDGDGLRRRHPPRPRRGTAPRAQKAPGGVVQQLGLGGPGAGVAE